MRCGEVVDLQEEADPSGHLVTDNAGLLLIGPHQQHARHRAGRPHYDSLRVCVACLAGAVGLRASGMLGRVHGTAGTGQGCSWLRRPARTMASPSSSSAAPS
jgi:hypothetical protein